MGLLFKSKLTVEELVTHLLDESFPKALSFLQKENEHAHRPLKLPEAALLEIGSAMCLFFLAEYLPDNRPDSKAKMGRAFIATQNFVQ